MIIKTGIKKQKSGYYKAILIIPKGLKTERHESQDVFIDAKTARKHAEFWAYECRHCGFITSA